MEGIGSRMLQVISPTVYWVDLPLACCPVLLKWSESYSVVSDSLKPHGLYSPWNSPGQNTGVGSLFLLQGIFPTQGSNPGLPHCRQILYQLSHKGRPRMERVAYPFFSRSPPPRNRVSHFKKLYFPLTLRYVWKFLSNLHTDHDKVVMASQEN